MPNEIVIHGFLTNEGAKISKSLGNGVDPFEIISRYGADALRFYLLGILSYEQDADFVEENLVAAYNSELANKLGNLVARVLTLASGLELKKIAPQVQLQVDYKDLRSQAFLRINGLNSEINTLKPWELLKRGQVEDLRDHLSEWIAQLQIISELLNPLIPAGAQRLSQFIKERSHEVKHLYPRR